MCRVLEEMREEVREEERKKTLEERIKAIRCMIQFEIPKDKILKEGYIEDEYKAAEEQYLK